MMNKIPFILSALLILLLVGCNGADGNTNVEEIDMNNFQEDAEKLGTLITLPAAPTEVRWIQYPLGNPNSTAIGPTDYVVIAVLRYESNDAAQIAEQLSAQATTRDWFVNPEFIRPWFPDEVKAAFVFDELTNFHKVNQTVYEPTPFTKSPYLQGYAFVTGQYVVVYLQTT